MAEEVAKKTNKTYPYKTIDFTKDDIKYLESAVLNGKPLSEIAAYFDTTENVLLKNLRRITNKEAKEKFKLAVINILSNATQSLAKVAQGYNYTEKEYKHVLQPLAETYFFQHFDKFRRAIKDADFDTFKNLLLEGIINEEAKEVKIYEKYAKPDINAIRDILRSYNPDLWDLEAKHRAIPQTKIVVKIENEPTRAKSIPATYVIDNTDDTKKKAVKSVEEATMIENA